MQLPALELPRVIVCGSRSCHSREHRELVEHDLERAVIMFESPIIVVHGGCRSGADLFADDWARRRGMDFEAHPADFNRFGPPAGPIRNAHMARLGAALCIALWDGTSRGTLSMIQCAVRSGIPMWIQPVRQALPMFPLWIGEQIYGEEPIT